ncbi:MAG: creatininase family protein [Bacteroidota bacterium]
MKSAPYLLATTNWKVVQQMDYRVAVLPWGATEAHNYHLPYGTDNYQAEHVAAEAARLAWEQGARIVVLPVIPFGVNTGQLDIKLCMNINPSTQLAILRDTVEVISRAGIQKLVIFNGHGGNHFKQMIRELSVSHPDVLVCSLNWYQAVDPAAYFDEPGDHAGELETSAMMHIAPDLVRHLEEAGDGAARRFRVEGLNEAWASTPRAWTAVTRDTGVGNPAAASAEKGAVHLQAVAEKISRFFVELDQVDVDDFYQ